MNPTHSLSAGSTRAASPRPSRGTILVLAESRYLEQRQPAGLVAALRARGLSVRLVDPALPGSEGALEGAAVAVARGRSPALLAALEARGVPVPNRAAAIRAVVDKRGMAGREDRHLYGVDLSGHLGPLTVQGEARWWEIRSEPRGTVKPHGCYGQAAWYLAPLGLEPVVRYELFVEDGNRADTQQAVLTVGLNAYLHRHAAKLQLAWVHREFEAAASGRLPGADAADLFQAQAQLYL